MHPPLAREGAFLSLRWPPPRPWHGAALLLCLGLLVYGRCVGFTLVTGDDWSLIAGNDHVTRWAQAPLRARLLTVEFGYPIPVTVASFALDWALWRGRAAGLHLTNLLLHLGCALCLFSILRRRASLGAALAGALLLLLHPVQVEAVAFVTQRKDLLATLLSLLALRGLLAQATASPRRVAAIALLTLLAGLSKPSALLMGPTLAAAWLVLRGRPRGAAAWALCASLAVMGGALLLLNVAVHRLNPVSLDGAALGPGARAALACGALHHYLKLLLLPLELAPRVPRPAAIEPAAAAGALCALALLVAAARRARRRRWRLALLWLIGAYLPISNLAPLNRYAADSYLYLLLPALGAALCFALDRTAGRRALLLLPVSLVFAAWAALAYRQTGAWRDDLALRAYLFRLYPEQREAMVEYAGELARAGRRGEALALREAFFARALARDPSSAAARHHLLRARLQRGDLDGARAALAGWPPDQRGRPAHLEAALELAMAQGDRDAARGLAARLLALGPAPPRAAELARLLERLEARRP